MITETRIDVRYPDCDRMGIVHHAVYPIWYEMARMDFFAHMGFSYADMNAQGINPPLVELDLKYKAPATYPGTVTVKAIAVNTKGVESDITEAGYTIQVR